MELRIFLFLSSFFSLTFTSEITTTSPTSSIPAAEVPKNVSSSLVKPTYKQYNFTDCSERNLDECGKVVFLFGNQNIYLPINRKQIKPFCQMQKSGARCILEWGKGCLSAFPRQALLMMVRGLNKNLKDRCSKEGANLYIKNKSCLRKSAKGLNKCMGKFRDDLNLVTTHSVRSEWLPFICCSIEKWKTCFNDSVSGSCDQDGLDYLKSSAETYISELRDVACTNRNSLNKDQCYDLESKFAQSKTNSNLGNSSTIIQPQSLVLPMFKIVSSYTDNQSKQS